MSILSKLLGLDKQPKTLALINKDAATLVADVKKVIDTAEADSIGELKEILKVKIASTITSASV